MIVQNDYIDGMITDLATHTGKGKMEMMVEYISLSEILVMDTYHKNNYQALTPKEEGLVYEVTVEALFNHYVK